VNEVVDKAKGRKKLWLVFKVNFCYITSYVSEEEYEKNKNKISH